MLCAFVTSMGVTPVPSTEGSEHWYTFCSANRGSRYIYETNDMKLAGGAQTNMKRMMWKFVQRTDGGYDIVNRQTGHYISPVADYNTQLVTTATTPAKGWTIGDAETSGMNFISSGTVEFNQTSYTGYPIYNYSAGNNGQDKTDDGCEFTIAEFTGTPKSEYTIQVNSANGTFYKWYGTSQQATGQTWNNTWISTSAAPQITMKTDRNDFGPSSTDKADIRPGTYTLSVTGLYAITGYVISGTATTAQTVTPAGANGFSFPANTAKTLSVDNVEDFSTSFTLAGSNASFPANVSVSVRDCEPWEVFLMGTKAVQGFQTTGRGKNTMLLRVALPASASMPVKLNSVALTLDNTTVSNVSAVNAYITPQTSNEFYALSNPQAVATASPASAVSLSFTDQNLTVPSYLWITAEVKSEATIGQSIDAAVTGINFTLDNQTYDKTVSLNPQGAAKIFGTWSQAFIPTTGNSRFYRIPAMILDKDGNIVVAADKRNGNNGDVGTHDVDIVSKISTDGGRTWTSPVIVADGDGNSASDTYGFGDPSLTRAPNGDLICFVVAGHVTFWNGQKHCYMMRSTDNGKTWSTPHDIYTDATFKDEIAGTTGQGFGEFSMFVTSGKGLTTTDGRMMLLCALLKQQGGTVENHILYSDDNGNSWTLDKNVVYSGGDEAKLEQRADGSILASVRTNGNRGFNVGTADGKQWAMQSTNSTLQMTACNADILKYNDDMLLHTVLSTNGRSNLRVYASLNGGRTWAEKFSVQGGSAAYSTMQKLPNGDLTILFEDASYDGGNGYAITYLTIPASEVQSWDNVTKTTVKNTVAGSGTGCDTYGTFSQPSPRFAKVWTSNASSGMAGLTVTADNGILDKASFVGTRCFSIIPSTAGATDVITITAPTGYVISGYTIGARPNIATETYTITAADGTTKAEVNNTTATSSITVSNINTRNTTFTVKANGTTNTKWCSVINFNITLEPESVNEYKSMIETSFSQWNNLQKTDLPFYLSYEAQQNLNTKYAAYDNDDATLAKYLELKDIVESGIVYPTDGGVYRFSNYGYTSATTTPTNGRYMAYSDAGLVSINDQAGNNYNTMFTLHKLSDHNYSLEVQGKYVAGEPGGNDVIWKTSTTAVSFTPELIAPGITAWTPTQGGTDITYLHNPAGSNSTANIVRWYKDGAFSQWMLEPVTNIDITVGATNYATAVFRYNAVIPDGVTVYYATSEDGQKVYFTQYSGSVIPAGAAVLLHAVKGTYSFAVSTSSVAAITGNLFQGDATLQTEQVSGKLYYALAASDDNKLLLKRVASGVNIPAAHAYIVKDATSASAEYLTVSFGEVEGLGKVAAKDNAPAQIYDLQGRRVDHVQKGIYIENGKKVILK